VGTGKWGRPLLTGYIVQYLQILLNRSTFTSVFSESMDCVVASDL
jgi:hypothetical protein